MPTPTPTLPDLASVFKGAIDYLQDGEDYREFRWTFSCNAINAYLMDEHPGLRGGRIEALLATIAPRLFEGFAGSAFDEFPWGPQRQFARAFWLTFLAELAEQGDLTWEGLK